MMMIYDDDDDDDEVTRDIMTSWLFYSLLYICTIFYI